jgi:hypothetical protein
MESLSACASLPQARNRLGSTRALALVEWWHRHLQPASRYGLVSPAPADRRNMPACMSPHSWNAACSSRLLVMRGVLAKVFLRVYNIQYGPTHWDYIWCTFPVPTNHKAGSCIINCRPHCMLLSSSCDSISRRRWRLLLGKRRWEEEEEERLEFEGEADVHTRTSASGLVEGEK